MHLRPHGRGNIKLEEEKVWRVIPGKRLGLTHRWEGQITVYGSAGLRRGEKGGGLPRSLLRTKSIRRPYSTKAIKMGSEKGQRKSLRGLL